MMNDKEKINIDINIGSEKIRLTVPFEMQDQTRSIEDELNSLLKRWVRAFPKRSEKNLLAMMLYHYASYYRELTEKHLEAISKAENLLDHASISPDEEK